MPTTTVSDVWTFNPDVGWISTARARTYAMASRIDTTWASVGRGISSLESAWECARADSYLGYVATLRSALVSATGSATTVTEAVRELEDRLESAKTRLGSSWARAREGSTSAGRNGTNATFAWAEDEPEPTSIRREHAAAELVQREARTAVQACAARLSSAAAELVALGTAWHGPAHGNPGWDVPRGGVDGVTVTQHGNRVVINSGDHAGGDDVEIRVDPSTGETLITINGVDHRYPPGVTITINTGGGNDRITIDETVPNRIRLVVGDGDDTVTADESGNHLEVFAGAGNDTVQTGSGRDYVSGGTGHDYVDSGAGDDLIAGGGGNDVLYGMDGDDVVVGGSGQDYLEGARGNDVLLGLDGDDIVSGGRGDDTLVGGGGDDTLYAGLGRDSLDGGTGTDSAFHTRGDTVAGSETTEQVTVEDVNWDETFTIGGNDDTFSARAEADLDMLNSSPTSQALLAELARHAQEQNKTYGIDATTGGNSANWAGSVNYNDSNLMVSPSGGAWYQDGRPPVVGLYHELGHLNQYEQPGARERWKAPDGYTGDRPVNPNDNFTDDAGQPLIERQNVGLEWDYDGDPDTPDAIDPDHDYRFTENALREEFGLPRRERY